MNPSEYRVRRATLDDLGPLQGLWKSMNFPSDDLARRVTEFQVAEGPDGKLLGAVGLQLAERQGRIHGEAFGDFALAEQLRPLLWERLQAVATNHGLVRIWTQEAAPFWNHCGMSKPAAEELEKLPAAFRTAGGGWLTLKLKEDLQEIISADQEFALFMEAEKQRTARTFQHARMLKAAATFVALTVFVLVLAGLFLFMRKNPHFIRP